MIQQLIVLIQIIHSKTLILQNKNYFLMKNWHTSYLIYSKNKSNKEIKLKIKIKNIILPEILFHFIKYQG